MCFSASASFIASGALAGAGATAITKVKKKKQLAIALVPIFFAVQQAVEGMQWLAVKNGPPNVAIGYGFLFFAYLFWPSYIPFAARAVEQDVNRKQLYNILLVIGIATSAWLLVALILNPLTITVHKHGIIYDVPGYFPYASIIFYLISTIGSGALSSRRYIKAFGILAGIFAGISWLMYTTAFTSVWCFFSAILSCILIADIMDTRKPRKR